MLTTEAKVESEGIEPSRELLRAPWGNQPPDPAEPRARQPAVTNGLAPRVRQHAIHDSESWVACGVTIAHPHEVM